MEKNGVQKCLYETLIDLKSKSFYLLDYKNDIDNCDDLLKEKNY